MTEETPKPAETPPDATEILQRHAMATFNSSVIGTFRHMLNIEDEDKQHVVLFAAARAIGELAALAFGKTDQLVEDLAKAMKEHATTVAALTKDERDNKLQQLILRVKEQLALAGAPAGNGGKGDPNVGPRLILPKRFKGRTH